MKKKLIVFIIAVLALVAFVCALSACGNGGSDPTPSDPSQPDVPGDDEQPEHTHSYGTPVWSWDGYTSATATFACTSCDDTQSVTDDRPGSTETKPATCAESGTRTYTATVTFGDNDYTDTKTETITALGHDYDAEFAWAENGESVTVTLTCKNDGSHVYNVPTDEIELSESIKQEATCNTPGEKSVTASVEYNNQSFTDTKEDIVIPATGAHTPGAWGSDENEHWQVCGVCGTEIAGTRAGHEYESIYTPSEIPEQNGTFSKECSVCDKVSGFINVGGSISVTYYASADDETGTTVDFTPYGCYDEDKSAYGVTYDAVQGRFVINLNAETVSAYYANGLKVTQSGGSIGCGDMSVYIHEDVTINSLDIAGGWVNFYIEGDGTLTINDEFGAAENPVISSANVIIKGSVTMSNQKLTVSGGSFESGPVNVDTLVLTDGKMTVNGTLTLKVLTVGAEGSDSAPVLEVTVDGDMNGISNSGSLDIDIYSGSVVVSNAQKAYSGISSNNAGDSIVVHGGSLTVNGFGVQLAFWNASSEDVCAVEVLGGQITLSGYGESAINNIQTSEDINGVVTETDADGVNVTVITPKA